ncbi:MAG: peptidase M14, partial [Flavobacteriaceae bacterium]|nr:peptidase M14 [Flavobacteriaceae bacterium]
FLGFSQQKSFSENLFTEYETYKESSLTLRRFKHIDIQPLIEKLKSEKEFRVKILGKSIEGRNISMISIGKGKTNILLWSQMHGDESTATMSLFDIFNYLKTNKEILNNVTLHFIPMLNPDGAEKFTRRNAIGIDINRDAVRLQSPESKILKAARDSLNADFGFNLHDQSKYYNTERTEKPATISFLAPAYNYEKSINDVRANAMKIIGKMNDVIQQYAPGQVGRYSDDFEPRAFGDNIQKWGTSTILIESGGFKNDPEKQFIRKLNYVSIIAAIHSISTSNYKNIPIKKYNSIPKNDRKLFDLKITNLTFPYLGKSYTVDLGIKNLEKENNTHSDFYNIGRITDIGDLSTYYGYQTLDANGLEFKLGETYPKIISNFEDFKKLDFKKLLEQGYTSVSINSLPKEIKFINYPINIIDIRKIIIPKNNSIPKPPISFSQNPTFLLTKNNKVIYAIINGFIYDL